MKSWFLLMLFTAAAAAGIAEFAPASAAAEAKAYIPACGENAGWIEVKPGTIMCTLKNGHRTGVLVNTAVPQ